MFDWSKLTSTSHLALVLTYGIDFRPIGPKLGDFSWNDQKHFIETHMDTIFVGDCTSGWITLPLWGLSEQPPSTLVCHFGWYVTLATSSKVLNMINLMTKHNGIIIGSNFRKVKFLILAPFLVFPIFDLLRVVRSFHTVRHSNRSEISHLETPSILPYY